MSSLANTGISISKKNLPHSRLPSYHKTISFYHKATSGQTKIDLESLTMPTGLVGVVQASSEDINTMALLYNQKNLQFYSLSRGELFLGVDFKVNTSSEIELIGGMASGAEQDEVFVGRLLAVPHDSLDSLIANFQEMIAKMTVPSGSVSAFGGDSIPTGYLLCDGSEVSRTVYADLFAAIGEKHGRGDGVNTFRIPDYRGRFLRGVAGSHPNVFIDPDKTTRTAMATGGATGNAVGSVQDDATARPKSDFTVWVTGETSTDGQHSHVIWNSAYGGASASHSLGPGNDVYNNTTTPTSSAGSHKHTFSASGTVNYGGDKETRPKNAYVNFIIKI